MRQGRMGLKKKKNLCVKMGYKNAFTYIVELNERWDISQEARGARIIGISDCGKVELPKSICIF